MRDKADFPDLTTDENAHLFAQLHAILGVLPARSPQAPTATNRVKL
jgi:hypothetical protein